MSTHEKSPPSPTKSDGSPRNTIRLIKTNATDNTAVEVKVAGESGAKVTVFGGDGIKTENRADRTKNATEEKNSVHQTGSRMDNAYNKAENEDKKPEISESVSKTKPKENDSDNKEDKKKEDHDNHNDADKPPEPMTQEEIDKIVSKYANMDKKELDKYVAFFWSVDTFGFGVFTIQQLAYRLYQLGRRLTGREVAKIFTDIDANDDGLISLEEYLEEMSKNKRKQKTTEEWQAEFERCDINHDGFICQEDIKAMLENHNVVYTMDDIYRFLYYNSAGEDWKLNIHEFRRAFNLYKVGSCGDCPTQ